jgi:hypothetical protein
MKDKIIRAVYAHKDELESNWSIWQKEMNIFTDIQELYSEISIHDANAIFTFIVMAYHNESKWIDIHKDRLENKKKIMTTILGEWALGEELFADVIYGRYPVANTITNWLLDYLKDWRWTAIEALNTLQALSAESVRNSANVDDLLAKSKALSAGIKGRQESERLLSQIQEEFITTDHALEMEGQVKLSDRISGNTSWEEFIASKKK